MVLIAIGKFFRVVLLSDTTNRFSSFANFEPIGRGLSLVGHYFVPIGANQHDPSLVNLVRVVTHRWSGLRTRIC